MSKHGLPVSGSGRSFGLLCSVLYSGLFSYEAAEAVAVEESLAGPYFLLGNPLAALYLVAAAVCAASIWLTGLQGAQAMAMLATAPILGLSQANAFVGLGFAALGAILLLGQGFFLRRARLKASLISAAMAAALLATVPGSPRPGFAAAAALASAACFLAFSLAVASGRVLPSLAPKEVVVLKRSGLSYRERQFILERVGGKRNKVIAIENQLHESTVRTILSTGSRKLGLAGSDELIAWASTRIIS